MATRHQAKETQKTVDKRGKAGSNTFFEVADLDKTLGRHAFGG